MNLLSLFSENPWLFFMVVAVFLLTLSVHEFSHALASSFMGDRTAERMGRLTLNPLAHVDILGFLTLITIGFGWGKPVPFNPYNLKYPQWGPTLVALAGPASNLVLGIVFSMLLALIGPHLGESNLLTNFLAFGAYLNFGLMIFNLIPIAPLDGSKPLLAILDRFGKRSIGMTLERQGTTILIGLIVLDLLFDLHIFDWISHTAEWLVYGIGHLLGV